ncbi:hypothetical protein [Pseudorhodoplanes sp.]|uniref:hypothetical protein n=1 Tax=Pseudorhodoplanes sp. TaxID=1934341 RepID=UPI003D0D7E18
MRLKKNWTEAEDALLIAAGSETSLQRLTVRLKRTSAAIRARAGLLRIPAPKTDPKKNRSAPST